MRGAPRSRTAILVPSLPQPTKPSPVTVAFSSPVADLRPSTVNTPVCETVSVGQISGGQSAYVGFDALHRAYVSFLGAEHESEVDINLVAAGGTEIPVRSDVLLKANGPSHFSIFSVVNSIPTGIYELRICYTTKNTPIPELIDGVATVLVLTEG